MARTRLRKFEDELQSAIETGMRSYSGHSTWNFVNAVLYCLDICTTLGELELPYPTLSLGTLFTLMSFSVPESHRMIRSAELLNLPTIAFYPQAMVTSRPLHFGERLSRLFTP